MSDSTGNKKVYKLRTIYSNVMGFLRQQGSYESVHLEGEVLSGQEVTVTPIGKGEFRVEAKYEGKLNPEKLVAMVGFNTRVMEERTRASEDKTTSASIPEAVVVEDKGCFPTIIKIGAVAVAVTLALSSCIKGCMSEKVDPEPTETVVQETTMPPEPEYYEAKVYLNEDMYASGTLYSTTNPFALQDIYPEDEYQFSEYQESIGTIDTSLGELYGIWNVDDLSQANTLKSLAYDIYAAYSNQYWMEENAINKTSDLKDNVNATSPKHELYQVQLNELEKQQNITHHNYNVAAGVYRSGYGYCGGKNRFK